MAIWSNRIIFFLLIMTTVSAQSTSKLRNGFVAWEQYLQECAAEMPYHCAGIRKALNQTCMFDTDCVQPATCQKTHCQCPKGHIIFRERCIKAPALDQPCLEGQCESPLVCNKREVCDCPSTMERNEGGCDAKCPPDTILIDGECLPYAPLNGNCKSNLQCNTAYSFCSSAGQCRCVRGTQAATDRCVATPLCPDGSDPMRRNNEIVKCNAQMCPTFHLLTMPTRVKLDSCPDGSYCVFPSYQDADGFCCQEKPYCPMGDPWKGKNCINPRNEAERCPPETHHCYAASRGTFCCPLPCPSFGPRISVVVHQGVCYERKSLHEKCTISAQCPSPAECLLMNTTSVSTTTTAVSTVMTCQCPDGYTLQYGLAGGKCQKLCEAGKLLIGTECLSLVLPSEKCNNSMQCTSGTKCIAGICDCPCGTILYHGRCVQKPQCPDFGNGIYDAITMKSGAIMECSPNSLFSPFAPAVCPNKSFCHKSTTYSGGMCCPLPEPVCPNGRSPPKGRDNEPTICDFSGNSSSTIFCPRNTFCYDYTATILPMLTQNPGRRGVCCSMDAVQPQPQPQPQPQWQRNQDQASQGNCPIGHRPKLQSNGQVLPCPFYSYSRQCGNDASCFLNPQVSARRPGAEGICCLWR